MKEPSHEQLAEDLLSHAHDELNRAAVKGTLSNQGVKAGRRAC